MKSLVWVFVVIGGGSVVAGSCVLLIPPGCSQRASNERNATASLKSIASAQADFRDNDRDENRLLDFWRGDVAGLYGAVPPGSSEMIKLIEYSVAAADAAPLGPGPGWVVRNEYALLVPKAGYCYRALRHDDEDPDALDPQRFAACAYPTGYPNSGRWTYIIREGGTIFRKDLGGRVPEVYPDAETLQREWSKLD